MADERTLSFPQNLTLEDRKLLTVTEVSDIGSFDEETIIAFTGKGELTVRGEGLHINRMSTETGELVIEGTVNSLVFSDNAKAEKGFFARLFG